jgi:hypothetical protein
MRLIENSGPFVIPPELKNILTSMPLEYGTGGGVGEFLPAIRVWSIGISGGNVGGYAWLAEHAGSDGPEHHINIAVLPRHKRCGAASFALVEIERQLARERFSMLYAQVNSNKPDTGLWVRLWLLRRGFQLLRRDIDESFSKLGDLELATDYPCTVYFRKEILPKDAQTSLVGNVPRLAYSGSDALEPRMESLDQNPPDDRSTPQGDCFEVAAKFIQRPEIVEYPDDYLLVHGNVAALRQDEAVNHAWVEEGEVVHEVSNGRAFVFEKKQYYERHRITNVRTYTVAEALQLCVQHGHWGPWG